MSREKEFDTPVVTSVRVENKDLILAKALGIRCSIALRNGIKNLAEGYLEGLKDVPEDWQELLIDLKKRDWEDTEKRFRSERQSRKAVSDFVELRHKIEEEEKHANEKIYVYDELDQVYCEISRVNYENEKWRYKRAARPNITDDEEDDS